MRNAGLEETQAGIKIAGRNLNNLRCADDTTLMAECEELKGRRYGKAGGCQIYGLIAQPVRAHA